MMAAITQRKTKTGKVSYIVAIRKRGARPIYKTFSKKSVATLWARETETAIERGNYNNYTLAESMLFTDAIERFKSEILINQAKTTITSVGPALSKLGRYFRGVTLANMSADVINNYVNKLKTEGKIKDGTILTRLGYINQVLNACSRVWRVECPNNILFVKTGCRMQRILKADPGRNRRPNENEIALIIGFKDSSPINLISDFAMQTAMRRAEISRLRYEDIDYSKSTLIIHTTKNGKPRQIPLTSRALQILRYMQKDFLNINGRVFNYQPNALTFRFTRMVKKLKIENLHFHDLRHEATSRFFETTNFTVLEIAAITGHSNMQMLKRYTHPNAALLAKKLAEQMG